MQSKGVVSGSENWETVEAEGPMTSYLLLLLTVKQAVTSLQTYLAFKELLDDNDHFDLGLNQTCEE